MQIFNYTNLLSKNKHSLFLCLFTLLLVSCNDEKVVDDPVKEPENGTSITIEGDVIDPPKDSRSTDPIVYFTGGYATGAGLYNGDAEPTVAAYPEDGYEIDFFYGGPETASNKKYDYASTNKSFFQCRLGGVNHYFKCGFKEKKRTLTLVANPTAGGTVSGAGTYKVKQAIPIKATPKSGYTFSGWSVTSGGAKIANASSASTTATLQSSSSTLQANFSITAVPVNISIVLGNESNNSANSGYSNNYITVNSNLGSRLSIKVYGDSNYQGFNYPINIGANTKIQFGAYEWTAVDYDGNTEESNATPTSFDVLIDNVVILNKLTTPTGERTLLFAKFNGKTYSSNNYKITFEVN